MIRLIIALVLLLVPSLSSAAITCTGTSFPFNTPTNPQAQDYTVPTVTNGITFAHVAARSGARDVTAITIGGVNVFSNRVETLVVGTDAVTEVFYLINATAGVNSVNVTWDAGPLSYVLTMVTCDNVDQSTPIADSNSATGTTGTAVTVDCNSAVGQLVVDFMGADSNTTRTEGAGQTNIDKDVADATLLAGASYEAGASPTVTMSHTLGASGDWATICASLAPFVDSSFGPLRRRH